MTSTCNIWCTSRKCPLPISFPCVRSTWLYLVSSPYLFADDCKQIINILSSMFNYRQTWSECLTDVESVVCPGILLKYIVVIGRHR